MMLIEAKHETPIIMGLHERIEDSTGIFRFDEEFGAFDVLVYDSEGFTWMSLEEVFQKGKTPKGEAKLSVLKGDKE